MINSKNNLLSILTIVFAIWIGWFFSIKYTDYYAPILKIENNLYNFKVIKKGEIISHFFTIKNIGKSDLKIFDIQTKCGCTTPDWYRKSLKPNEIDSVKINYDTNIIGAFTKYIVIESNSKDVDNNRIYIQGIVIE